MRHLPWCVSHMRTCQTCHRVWHSFTPYIWSCGLFTTNGGCNFSSFTFSFQKKNYSHHDWPTWHNDSFCFTITLEYYMFFFCFFLCVWVGGGLMFNNYPSWFKPLLYLLFQIMPEQAQPIRKDVTYVNQLCLPCVFVILGYLYCAILVNIALHSFLPSVLNMSTGVLLNFNKRLNYKVIYTIYISMA